MKSSCSSSSRATHASAKGIFSLTKLEIPYRAVAEWHPLVIVLPLREPALLAQLCDYPPNTGMFLLLLDPIQGSNTPINTPSLHYSTR